MKSYNLIKYLFGYLFLAILASGFSSCEDKSNEWDVDNSHNRLFKPLTFNGVITGATSLDIIFSKIPEASTYVFEFSEDSLEFKQIVKTVELFSDTMNTIYSNSGTIAKIEFRKKFDGLKGSTRHSVRMRGVNKDGSRSSNYTQFLFTTPQEYLFNKIVFSSTWARFYWPAGSAVSNFELIEVATGENILTDTKLTAQEIASGEKQITNLKIGTIYTAKIYHDSRIRGDLQFKTSGLAESTSYDVQVGDDIAAKLSELAAAGKPNITLNFASNVTYDINALTIPAGINSVVFSAPSGESSPMVNLNTIGFSTAMELLSFENVTLNGDFTKRLIDTGTAIKNISFTGCVINNYNCVVRLQNSGMTVNSIIIDDCQLNNIGGYGVLNIGGTKVLLGDVQLSNSTLTQIAQLFDIRTAANSLLTKNCTFYNNSEVGFSYFVRLDNNNLPIKVTVEKCIFSGANKGLTLTSTQGTYSTLSLSFAGSYMTLDMFALLGSRKFTDITEYKGIASKLFTNPDGGDFSIKSDAGFSEANTVGDPRWIK